MTPRRSAGWRLFDDLGMLARLREKGVYSYYSLENLSYMTSAGLKRRIVSTDRFGGLYLDAGVVAFLMARKDVNDYRPFPGILPAVTIGNRYVDMNLTYLPKKAVHGIGHAKDVDPTIGGVVFVQFKLRMTVFSF